MLQSIAAATSDGHPLHKESALSPHIFIARNRLANNAPCKQTGFPTIGPTYANILLRVRMIDVNVVADTGRGFVVVRVIRLGTTPPDASRSIFSLLPRVLSARRAQQRTAFSNIRESDAQRRTIKDMRAEIARSQN
jgi:hypothetical protein